jgi:predicted transcriptional regulator
MHLIEKRNRDDKKDDKKEKKISLKENLSRGEDERTIAQFLALSSNPEAIGQRVDKILEAREQARKLAEKYL